MLGQAFRRGRASWLLFVLAGAGCAWDWDAVDRAIHPPIEVPDSGALDGGTDAASHDDASLPPDAGPDFDAGHDAGMDGGGRDARIEDDARMPDPPLVDGEIREDAEPTPDTGAPDATAPPDEDAGEDPLHLLGCDALERANGSSAITAARAAADGDVSINIGEVLVSYVLPAIGADPAGFFVQAEADGPALFVSVNPATLDPRPEPGDCIAFRADAMETVELTRHVAEIEAYELIGTGHALADLIQDLSAETDVVSASSSYEHELVQATGTLGRCDFGVGDSPGPGHFACELRTVGLPEERSYLYLRTPLALAEQLELAEGCTVAVTGTPLWRHVYAPNYSDPSVSAYRDSEIEVGGCPGPTALDVTPLSATTLRVRFDRRVATGSVLATGAQLSATNGLSVTAAALAPEGAESSHTLLVTTSAQTPGEIYELTIDGSLTDDAGTPMTAPASFELRGYGPPADALINEVSRASGCHVIELRVVQTGSLDGFTLESNTGLIELFDHLFVETNDYVLANLCSNGGIDQYSMPDELPSAVYQRYSELSRSISASADSVILRDASGAIVDAVLLSDGDPPSDFALESAWPVRAAHAWLSPFVALPPYGYDAASYVAAAALDLDALTPGMSLQRTGDFDTDTREDWDNTGQVPSTLGANNAGQEDL